MTKKIAIPVEDGLLASHFGHASIFAVIETSGKKIVEIKNLIPPPHEPGLLPKWLGQQGVTDVIAAGMGQKAIYLFNQEGIIVFVGAEKKEPAVLASDLINGALAFGKNDCSH